MNKSKNFIKAKILINLNMKKLLINFQLTTYKNKLKKKL
jgi:hypothetical protein